LAVHRFFNVLILAFMFIFLILTDYFSVSAQPTNQETHGPNSPVIYTGKGNVKVSITVNEAKEICKTLQELIETYKKERDIEISELKKRIAKIHETEFHVLPKEADEWADHFISTLPLRKDKVTTQENEEKTRFEKEKINIPLLFEYTIKKFDDYVLALKKHDQRVNLKQEQIPEIIVYGGSSKSYDSLRIVFFPNGTSLEVHFRSGLIKNDQFIVYPSLSIYEVKNGQIQSIAFSMVHQFTIGSGFVYGEGELIDSFKEELTRAYDRMIERAYLRSSQ